MSFQQDRRSRRMRLKLNHAARSNVGDVISNATPPFRSAPGFLDLPRELRDTIYEECLVSESLIELSDLKHDFKHSSRRKTLGLVPNLLTTCRQVREEGSDVLYGANTFYVDLQPMWQYTRERQIRNLLDEQTRKRHPYACVACSDLVHCVFSAKRVRSMIKTKCSFCKVRGESLRSHSAPWNINTRRIKRLQISLRPYSYSQYTDVTRIKWHLQAITPKRDRRLVHSCLHTLQRGIPPLRDLDICIVHIGKRPLAVAEEDFELSAAVLYPLSAKGWRWNLRQDMARETTWLLSLAAQSAKHIVIPDGGSAQGLSKAQRDYLERACARSRRGFSDAPGQPEITDRIPERLRRTGNLAYMRRIVASNPARSFWATAEARLEYDFDTAQEAIARARKFDEISVLGCGPDLIFDSF